MQDRLRTAVIAAIAFIKWGDSEDEYALVDFANKPRREDFTRDAATLQSRFLSFISIKAKGTTALYDAVSMGLKQLEEANNPRRALLLISDGQENNSRSTFANVKQLVREKDVPIYAIGMSQAVIAQHDPVVRGGQEVLSNLTGLTGGEAFFPFSGAQPLAKDFEDTSRKIARELKSQYVLTYRSTNTVRDGKWRNIKVTIDGHGRKLTVRAKKGYTAPF